jgi:nucleotide-binding universal stress UspA family protein
MYRKIMVGFDGSAIATRALGAALLLAKESGGEVLVTFVQEEGPRYSDDPSEVTEEREAIKRHSLDLKREAEMRIAGAGLNATVRIVTGNAPRLLCDVAKQEGVDLLVIGHSGRSGLWGGLLGGTADKVVDHAPCSVLVVRGES